MGWAWTASALSAAPPTSKLETRRLEKERVRWTGDLISIP
jgi:hypothetical protein